MLSDMFLTMPTLAVFFATASQGLHKDIDNVAHYIFPSNSLKSLFNNINEFNEIKNNNLEIDTPILL